MGLLLGSFLIGKHFLGIYMESSRVPEELLRFPYKSVQETLNIFFFLLETFTKEHKKNRYMLRNKRFLKDGKGF